MFNRVYIEISNLCNVQCSFCPIVDRDKKVMGASEFKRVLEEVKDKTKEVCLHLMGEPSAHPQLEAILNICSEENVEVNFTTNGLLIKRKQELILRNKSLRQINFSLQSFKDNFPHKSIQDYLKNIFEFTVMAFERRPDLYINYRMWNVGSDQDNDEIFDYVEDYFNLKINRKIQVENIKSKKLQNRLYLHFDSRFEWPSLNDKIVNESGRCHGLKSHIGIHANGDVVPCCLDKEAVINLGNIFETSLDEILESKLAKDLRDGFMNNRLCHELCKRCDYIQRFNKS